MWDDFKAKCPYFRESSKKKIFCEGITDDCFLSLTFISEPKRALQRRLFCDAKYENCEIYRMLEEKYED
jgi:hypothetical protein